MTPEEKFEKWWKTQDDGRYSKFLDMIKPLCLRIWLEQQKEIDRLWEGIRQFLDGIDIEILQKLLEEGKDESEHRSTHP
ncbi:MAG: hypothetical protein EHM49_01240 [Deltaproteobacteria bacterium]|nr:MAG: hypothetical protein EHM49_01240 [Deltaproteobacteria bacterium]